MGSQGLGAQAGQSAELTQRVVPISVKVLMVCLLATVRASVLICPYAYPRLRFPTQSPSSSGTGPLLLSDPILEPTPRPLGVSTIWDTWK